MNRSRFVGGLAVALLALLPFISSVHAKVVTEGAKLGEWTMDYDAAVALAKKEDKPILINFTGSDWCGWCKLMDKNVFAGKEFIDYAAKNVVLVTIDFPRDKSIVPTKYVKRNNDLKNDFGVRGYPTYILLESDATSKVAKLGAGRDKTPASFVKEIQGALKTSKKGVADYIKANPKKAEAFKKAIAEVEAKTKLLQDWIKTSPQQNDENMKKYKKFIADIETAKSALNKF